MDRRYDILEAEKVRDSESYHQNILESKKLAKTKTTQTAEREENIETMPIA